MGIGVNETGEKHQLVLEEMSFTSAAKACEYAVNLFGATLYSFNITNMFCYLAGDLYKLEPKDFISTTGPYSHWTHVWRKAKIVDE